MATGQQITVPPAAVAQFRLENGLCYFCGAKCFDVAFDPDDSDQGRRRLEPLTIEGEVHRGRCLLCQPLPLQLSAHNAVRRHGDRHNHDEGVHIKFDFDVQRGLGAKREHDKETISLRSQADECCRQKEAKRPRGAVKDIVGTEVLVPEKIEGSTVVESPVGVDSLTVQVENNFSSTNDDHNNGGVQITFDEQIKAKRDHDEATTSIRSQTDRSCGQKEAKQPWGAAEDIVGTDVLVPEEPKESKVLHSLAVQVENNSPFANDGNRAIIPSTYTRTTRAKPGKNPFSDYSITYWVKYDDTGAFDLFLLNDVPKILGLYGEKLPNLRDRFLRTEFFSSHNFGENSEILREAFVERMRELHALTGSDGCITRYLKPSIELRELEIDGEKVGGYGTIRNLPIAKALKFVRELDESNTSAGRRLRRGARCGEWEPMIDDQGFKVYYYRTHNDGLAEQVINVWAPDVKDRHGCIATDIRKWPAIPDVFVDLGRKIEVLYGRSFHKTYFLGQVQVSKMECQNPRTLPLSIRADHDRYSGNKLASHHDHAREGEVIVTVLLAEPVIFRLYNGTRIVEENALSPGSAYCMRCPGGHSFDADSRNVPCRMLLCPRHGLRHGIECAHSPDCEGWHSPDSATARLPRRRGPRFAAVLRYFKRKG